MASFMDLAIETRLQIYSDLLTASDHAIMSRNIYPRYSCQYAFPCAVLLLNKQINEEAKTIFYGRNPFSLRLTGDKQVFMQAKMSVLTPSKINNHISIQNSIRALHLCVELHGLRFIQHKPHSSNPTINGSHIAELFETQCTEMAKMPALQKLEISFTGQVLLSILLLEDGRWDFGNHCSSDICSKVYSIILEPLVKLPSSIHVTRGTVVLVLSRSPPTHMNSTIVRSSNVAMSIDILTQSIDEALAKRVRSLEGKDPVTAGS